MNSSKSAGTQPKDLPDLANTLSALGRALTDTGKAREAEPRLHEALEIRRKVLHKGHWLTANTESRLGGCLTKQGRYDEAEPFLLNSLSDDRIRPWRTVRPGPAGPGVGTLPCTKPWASRRRHPRGASS